jgi:hypothetical protein
MGTCRHCLPVLLKYVINTWRAIPNPLIAYPITKTGKGGAGDRSVYAMTGRADPVCFIIISVQKKSR